MRGLTPRECTRTSQTSRRPSRGATKAAAAHSRGKRVGVEGPRPPGGASIACAAAAPLAMRGRSILAEATRHPGSLDFVLARNISDIRFDTTHRFYRLKLADRTGTTASMNTAQKLERPKSLTDMAIESIRSSIVEGRLSLGEHLSEAALALSLGISKTPVREALLQLRGEGLVEIHPQRGT